jgi:hypothetical protein
VTDPQALIVAIATTVVIFATSSTVAGWVNRSVPYVAMLSLALGLGLLGFVHLQLPDGLDGWDIPNAFIQVAAMVLN